MPLAAGSRLGPYELLAPLGSGGMGEVWRARDTRLSRAIALKFIAASVATDPDRLARFRREAQLLASLQHPNIAGIHGLEETGGPPFLVLELVEGEDLAARLARGPLPVDEALAAARQVAEALEEAHEHGIVHRDLKPANVKVTPEGKVKVLDFGLAKAWSAEQAAASGSSPDLSHSPTLTHASTEAGLVLGTASYMSPEQARGKRVDKRSDIWAFGALLYEMLTGRRLFAGETLSDILAAVLTRPPDLAGLPAATPRGVRRLLERCLERDPKLRLRDIGEARIVLSADGKDAEEPVAPAGRLAVRRTWALVGAGALAGLLLSAGLSRLGGGVDPGRPVLILDLALDELDYSPFGRIPLLSPDGRRLVYHASGRLWVRDLTELAPREIPGTEEALYPTWSPDARRVAYVQRGRLWTVDVEGGQPSELSAVPPDLAGSGGTAWSDDGQIVAAGSDKVGLWSVPAAGGEARELVSLDRAHEADFHEVSALPGGRGFLFTVHRTEGLDTIGLYAGGTRRVVLRLPGESLRSPVYSPTGHILYRRDSTSVGVWALAFSLDRLAVSGAPFPVMPGASAPSVGRDGSLAVVRASFTPSELVWVDRAGGFEKVAELPGPATVGSVGFSPLSLSADGRRAVVNVFRGGYGELWVCDLGRGTTSRLVAERADALTSVWTPDGRVIFTALLGGRKWNLFRVAPGGSRPERLLKADDIQTPRAVSPDGRFLVFAQGPGGAADLWLLPLTGSGEAAPWQMTTANDGLAASFSPDGRFLAYDSDESGRSEVYVRPFPQGEGRWQLSTEGGQVPVWSPAGGEVLYRSRDRMMAVTVEVRGAGLEVGPPRPLFSIGPDSGLGLDFALARDGRRLLMIRSRQQNRITLLLEWPRELERLAGAVRTRG